MDPFTNAGTPAMGEQCPRVWSRRKTDRAWPHSQAALRHLPAINQKQSQFSTAPIEQELAPEEDGRAWPQIKNP